MREHLLLCDRPHRYIGTQRVLVVVESRLAGCLMPTCQTGMFHVTLRPLAIVLFDREVGRMVLARGTPVERVEELLLNETRWAHDA